jgi:putative phosphoesterase
VPACAGSAGVIRVAIVSDTHGALDPRVAEAVAGCDVAVHGGDVGAAAVLQGLRPRCGRVLAVLGNNDLPTKWPPADAAALASLPEEAELALPGGRLVVVHGHRVLPAARRHARLRRRYPDARAVVYGHSHRLVCDTEASPWILNPGAAGRARTHGGPSCIVLTASESGWQVAAQRFSLEARGRIQR